MTYLSLDPSSKHSVFGIVMGNQPVSVYSNVFSKILIMLHPDTFMTWTKVWLVGVSVGYLSPHLCMLEGWIFVNGRVICATGLANLDDLFDALFLRGRVLGTTGCLTLAFPGCVLGLCLCTNKSIAAHGNSWNDFMTTLLYEPHLV